MSQEVQEKKAVVSYSATELGIPDEKAKEIRLVFEPMLKKMEDLEVEYNAIVEKAKAGITMELCEEAGELLKQYVKVRTGTGKIHASAKKFYLVMGRAVDGFKNAQLAAGHGKEEKLKNLKEHFEILEKQRIAEVEANRIAELQQYEVDTTTISVGTMSEEVYKNFLAGCKLNFETRKAAEEKAAKEAAEAEAKAAQYKQRREELLQYGKYFDQSTLSLETTEEQYQEILKKCKADQKEAEAEAKRIREQNEKLQKEAEAKEKAEAEARKIRANREEELKPYVVFIENYSALLDMKEVDYKKELKKLRKAEADQRAELEKAAKARAAKEAKEKKEAEAKAKKEAEAKAAAEEKLAAERKAAEEKLKKEREEKEALLKEKQEREAAEAKEKAEAAEAKRQQALLGSKEILTMWVDSTELQLIDLTKMDPGSKEVHQDIVNKFNLFKEWAKSQVKNLK